MWRPESSLVLMSKCDYLMVVECIYIPLYKLMFPSMYIKNICYSLKHSYRSWWRNRTIPPIRLAKAVMHLTCILEVPGLNIGLDIDCPGLGFPWFFSVC